eukprot:gene33242-40218_t
MRRQDPNILTLRRKTALKLSCGAQNMAMVDLLLQHNERKLEELERRRSRELEAQAGGSSLRGSSKQVKDAWVEYRDKKTRRSFYYNTITRKSQFDLPKGFEPDRTKLVKDATFGMSFYH